MVLKFGRQVTYNVSESLISLTNIYLVSARCQARFYPSYPYSFNPGNNPKKKVLLLSLFTLGNLRHEGTLRHKKLAQVYMASKGLSWDLNLGSYHIMLDVGKANNPAHGKALWKLEMAGCMSTNRPRGPTLTTCGPLLVFLCQQEHRGEKPKQSKKQRESPSQLRFCWGCSKPLSPCPQLGWCKEQG